MKIALTDRFWYYSDSGEYVYAHTPVEVLTYVASCYVNHIDVECVLLDATDWKDACRILKDFGYMVPIFMDSFSSIDERNQIRHEIESMGFTFKDGE